MEIEAYKTRADNFVASCLQKLGINVKLMDAPLTNNYLKDGYKGIIL